MSLLAIGWEPEIRGLLTVVMGVVVLMGSVYMILATNIGSRLSFLVSLTGLMGWMVLMGMTWWIYGIGLKGPEPSWVAIPGVTIIQDVPSLRSAGALESLPEGYEGASPSELNEIVADQFLNEGYIQIGQDDPAYGPAVSAPSSSRNSLAAA
jgi:ABC-type xylose transport system permease subunit